MALSLFCFLVSISREILCDRIFGTRGELEGDGHIIRTFEFSTLQSQTIDPTAEERQLSGGPLHTLMSGHGYGDWYLMRDFVDAVSTNDPSKLSSTPEQACLHLYIHHLFFFATPSLLYIYYYYLIIKLLYNNVVQIILTNTRRWRATSWCSGQRRQG